MSEIKFKCPKCRNEDFKVPRKDLRETDKITCAKCGFTTTYAALAKPTTDKLMRDAEDTLAKAVKRFR